MADDAFQWSGLEDVKIASKPHYGLLKVCHRGPKGDIGNIFLSSRSPRMSATSSCVAGLSDPPLAG